MTAPARVVAYHTLCAVDEGSLDLSTAISQGATLAVHAERSCDIGMVGYEMTMLAARVGHVQGRLPLRRRSRTHG